MTAFHISLPATSANLGPGFDTLGLALDLHLEISADPADSYSIEASGRDAEHCRSLRRNLLISVYEQMLRAEGREPRPLAIQMVNGIPLGMGCGSSAAARLAGIALANHFADLDWNDDRILLEACRLEGHPDNVAASWLGGFTVSAAYPDCVKTVSFTPPTDWSAILVLGEHALSTSTARAILPDTYAGADAIANVQNTALLTAAFLTGRADLLKFAMQDRMHQPFRSEACPLLPLLLPIVGESGILGVALSGAGPGVLALIANPNQASGAVARIRTQLGSAPAEIVPVKLAPSRLHSVHSAHVSGAPSMAATFRG